MLDFEKLKKIENESERVSKTYELFNEDNRLNRSKAARVEFITNIKYIEKHLKQGDNVLDIGAGAGEYSLYFADKGYDVTAVELAENNIKAFKKKVRSDMKIVLKQGNAMDLSSFPDEHFDIVLLFGPLYHLQNENDRQKCISEAKRVCKQSGTLFFSYIANDMVILTEFCYRPDFFKGNTYNHDTFKLEDFPFVFFTVGQCRQMLCDGGMKIISEIASDGVSEMLEDKINAMDDESYEQYLKYHLYCCEKPEMIGHSNHLLFIGKK